MAYGDHVSARDVDLTSGNTSTRAVAVDSTYAYVIDQTDRKVYVYLLSDGAHQSSKDFNLTSANINPFGIAVDSTYAYVTGHYN